MPFCHEAKSYDGFHVTRTHRSGQGSFWAGEYSKSNTQDAERVSRDASYFKGHPQSQDECHQAFAWYELTWMESGN